MSLNKVNIKIGYNDCTLEELCNIHIVCDVDFEPKLSSRVNIQEYCQKLINNSSFVTAKIEDNLAGIVAIYCNDLNNFIAFISSICVLPQFRGVKIGEKLLIDSISLAKVSNMKRVRLEVGKNNIPAIKLYEKFNFCIIEEWDNSYLMEVII